MTKCDISGESKHTLTPPTYIHGVRTPPTPMMYAPVCGNKPEAFSKCRTGGLRCAPALQYAAAWSRAAAGRWRKDHPAGWPRCDLQHPIPHHCFNIASLLNVSTPTFYTARLVPTQCRCRGRFNKFHVASLFLRFKHRGHALTVCKVKNLLPPPRR